MTNGRGSLFGKFEPGSREERFAVIAASLLAIIMAIADQITKIAVVKGIPFASKITVIPHCFNLTYITNTGAAWGIFSGKGWLLLTISLAVLAGIIIFLGPLSEGWPERVYGLLMVGSGIIGNSIDRIFRGQVVDFLQVYAGSFYWPSFNVADSCITVGVLLFIVSSIFRPETGKANGGNGFVKYKPTQ